MVYVPTAAHFSSNAFLKGNLHPSKKNMTCEHQIFYPENGWHLHPGKLSKINMEPKNHPIEKKTSEPSTSMTLGAKY